MSSMLRGNVYAPHISNDTNVLKEVIKGGNLPKEQKKKASQIIQKIEKEEKREKTPALDLRAMYGN